MRRSPTSTFAGVVCAVLLFCGLPGRAWADDDVCADPSTNLNQTLDVFLTQFTTNLNKTEIQKQALEKATEARPSSDGFSKGGRLDLLRRAFVGLGLGQVTHEDGQLVFNFNPDALRLDSFGQFSPRIVVHKPTLYGALEAHINMLDQGLQTPARDELEKSFGDLDDVEYSLRWTPGPFEPAADLKDVASTLLDEVVPATPSTFTNDVNLAEAEIGRILGLPGPFVITPLMNVCNNPKAKSVFDRLIRMIRNDIPAVNAALDTALDNNGFKRLADLIEGNPRLVFNGNYRSRSGAAGPDTTSVDITWQQGWVSYNGAKRYANGKPLDVKTINAYFTDHGRLADAAPLFSLVGSYSETNAFSIPITGVTDPFSQDKGHKLSIKGTAARYFGGGRDRKLELTATYDDVTGDKKLQNRFVADLTWVETLNDTIAQAVGGSDLVVTVVWANKPEFRGQVDKDFGMRAGLKWSLGNGTKN